MVANYGYVPNDKLKMSMAVTWVAHSHRLEVSTIEKKQDGLQQRAFLWYPGNKTEVANILS